MATEKDVLELTVKSTLSEMAGQALTVYDKSSGAPSGMDGQILVDLDSDKIDKTSIANNLTTTTEGYVLDARQGKVLSDGKLDKTSVVNNLTTTTAGFALDARQGKVLNDGKINKDGSNSAITQLTFIGQNDAGQSVNLVVQYNTTDGTFDFPLPSGITGQLFQELFFHAKTTEALSAGDTIQYAGAQGRHPLIKKAVGSELMANPYLFIGIAATSAAANSYCKVTWFGNVDNLDTDGYTTSTVIYADVTNITAGKFTNIIPTAPNPKIHIGAVTLAKTGGVNNGTIFVRPMFHNKMMNGDDVLSATPTTGQVLKFTANNRFELYNLDGAMALKADLDAYGKILVSQIPSMESILAYGIEKDVTAASTAFTRVGNSDLHRSLPIQNAMRRCLLRDDGTVNYYLSLTDSTKKTDGTSAIFDGTDGQVMVEIPEFYIKFTTSGNIIRIMLSTVQVDGLYHKIPKMYISAYEAALDRTNSKLSSVVNTTTQYRGGDNRSAWDAQSNTLLGRPATSISLTSFRLYARNRGSSRWNCYTYMAHKTLYWLYMTEYANFNCQLGFNAALTIDGYRQGGLGTGVADLDYTKWNTFNGVNPFIPCGHTNILGNTTGVVAYVMPPEYDVVIKTTYVPSYRGIENPFGHIFKWTDGCKCRTQSDTSGGRSEFYDCSDPSNYQDIDYANYNLKGLLSRAEGYGKMPLFGEFGDVIPVSVGGGSTTYMSDYFYTSIPASGEALGGVLFGGDADLSSLAGLSCTYTHFAPSNSSAYIGSRLCFITA